VIDHKIECEECENTSFVASYEEVIYCPICGRRAKVELIKFEGQEYWEDYE
jgi:hypothetical protein